MDSNTDQKEKQENPTQAQKLIALVLNSRITLFHDEFNEPYAWFKVNDHFELWKIRSKQFKRWLAHIYWDRYKRVPNNETIKTAENIIEAEACFKGPKHQLHNRVAFHDNAIWYDLGNWQAIKINCQGWSVVSEPPILFRQYDHQKTQVRPEPCKEFEIGEILSSLDSLINIKDENQKYLFIINLISALTPNIPHPIDVLHGDQGTAKTTTSTIKKELVDPSELKNIRFSNSYNEFVQQADHNWHIVLDNLTSLPSWFSDTLCRVVTGEGFSKRQLYTDDEDIIYKFRRCVTINGINMVPSKPDILDRCLIFEFEPISQENRIEESIFWERFNEMKPKILGAMFLILSKAMKIFPNIKLGSKPRMADFARWGAAIAIAMGRTQEEFMQAYQENMDIQNVEALEANPISRVIITFMEERPIWRGGPTELFLELVQNAEELKIDMKDRKFPNDPRWLWRKIKEVKPNLFAVGIEVEKDDTNRATGRKIVLRNMKLYEESGLHKYQENVVSDVMMSERQHDNNDINLFNMTDAEIEKSIDDYIREND